MSQSDSDEMKTLNIILIGETGVGKSSFINLFPIYFKNDHLHNVDQNLSLLIPSLVTIYDKNGDEHELRVGSSKYEIQETGASGTQVVTPYEFICEKDNNNFRVRLIDTPGLGDPRGLQKDNEHCEMVLNYLDELDEVHAFCFLMRPTNTRNTILFDYCIQQIMTRLHKSACQNIIFVFTNTSGQHYKPGNTLPGLKRMIKDINSKLADMTINLDKINMFSLDNECLNYLVAKQNNVKLEEYSKQCYEKSWEVSKKECLRLLEYVENLKPHEVRSTTSLNKTSGLIYDMYKPLSDISNLLQENIVALEKNKKEIESSNEKVNELKEKLYMNQTELEVIKLESPVLICTNTNCATKIETSDGNTRWNFDKRCHDPCTWVGKYRQEVPGHWGLRFCSQIEFISGDCKNCKCSYEKHMTIFYNTKKHTKKVIIEDVRKEIENKVNYVDIIKKYVDKVSLEKKELEEESQFITECAAKFAIFFKNNAITPFCDSYEEYIRLEIERQKSMGESVNFDYIDTLKENLEKHKKLKIFFDKSSESLTDKIEITFKSIEQDINQLFKLKHTGEKIKEIYEKRNACIYNVKSKGHQIAVMKGIKLCYNKLKLFLPGTHKTENIQYAIESNQQAYNTM